MSSWEGQKQFPLYMKVAAAAHAVRGHATLSRPPEWAAAAWQADTVPAWEDQRQFPCI